MGGVPSNFLVPVDNNGQTNARATTYGYRTTADKKTFNFFMTQLRKYLKRKRPNLTKEEVKEFGKSLWNEFTEKQKQIFADELSKRERRKEMRKNKVLEKSSRFSLSALTNFFYKNERSEHGKKGAVDEKDYYDIENHVNQKNSGNVVPRRLRERKRPVLEQQSCDNQAGPSTSRGSDPCVVLRRRRRGNTHRANSNKSLHRGRTERHKRNAHDSSEVYTTLSDAVKRFFKNQGDAQYTMPQYGYMKRRKRRSCIVNATNSFDSYSTRSVILRPNRHSVQSQCPDDDGIAVDDDDSYSEDGFLYSGASTTSMSSTQVGSEQAEK